MSKNKSGPEASASDMRYQQWVSQAYAFAAACLVALALAEFLDFATPKIQTLLMLGIMLAGTAAWILQAKVIDHESEHIDQIDAIKKILTAHSADA